MPRSKPLASSPHRHLVSLPKSLSLGSVGMWLDFTDVALGLAYHGSHKRNVVNKGRHNSRHPQDENDGNKILI